MPKGVNKLYYEVTKYVKNNIYKYISVNDIAKYLNLNRSYLSHKFKTDFSISISNYIKSEKLAEGENLLKYSKKNISDISNLLCFSSQSHFQNAFKEKYGVTPQKYRNSQLSFPYF